MTVARRPFAPALRRVTSAPSGRRVVVLTLLYGNAIFAAFLGLLVIADAVFDFLQLEISIGARVARIASLCIWALVNAWVGKRVFEGSRKGYRYGLVLFGLLLVQEILGENPTAVGIVISIMSMAALASIKDELTN